MIVSRYGAACAPAVGPPHFLPFFADARRLLGLRVLGADAGLFALAGLFAARFGVAAAAGFGEAFGDAFALAAGAAFLPFDFGSFWPMTTITWAYERWGRGSARARWGRDSARSRCYRDSVRSRAAAADGERCARVCVCVAVACHVCILCVWSRNAACCVAAGRGARSWSACTHRDEDNDRNQRLHERHDRIKLRCTKGVGTSGVCGGSCAHGCTDGATSARTVVSCGVGTSKNPMTVS